MGRFVLYKPATLRVNENSNNSLFCEVLSQSSNQFCEQFQKYNYSISYVNYTNFTGCNPT